MCSTVQLSRSRCRMTASIFYHTVLSLSRTFLKSFCKGRTLFATAMIDYHIFKALSTTFSKSFLVGSFYHRAFRQLWYIIISKALCQQLFWSFFKLPLTGLPVSGERGIWTLARREPSTPLAGAPLQPLEYFSNAWINILFNSAPHEQCLLYLHFCFFVNCFLQLFYFFSFQYISYMKGRGTHHQMRQPHPLWSPYTSVYTNLFPLYAIASIFHFPWSLFLFFSLLLEQSPLFSCLYTLHIKEASENAPALLLFQWTLYQRIYKNL